MSVQTIPELFLAAMREYPRPDCFSYRDGSGQYRDAYITCSATGTLVHTRWPTNGLRLHHL